MALKNPFRGIVKAITAQLVSNIAHPKGYASWLNRLFPNSRIDFDAKVGDGMSSNVFMSPILWVSRAFLEAKVGILSSTGKEDIIDSVKHPLAALLRKPNPFYSGSALWLASLISWFTNGNVYWIKAKNKAGQVLQLWYIPHWMIEPKWEGKDFISYYLYSPGDGQSIKIDPTEIVHLRFGIDPKNPRKGLSQMAILLREIFNDDESANFVAALLINGGVPGVVISPKEASSVGIEDLQATKAYIREQFSGDNRGSPLAIGAPTEVQEYGYDPKKMNLDVVRNVSEERVCALIGMPSAVVGFGTGMEQTQVGATLQELHRIAWINCVMPTQDLMAEELTRSLGPDFQLKDPGETVAWDRSRVRALQDDLNKETDRLAKAVAGGFMMVSEARKASNLDVMPEHEIFLRPMNLIESGPGAPPEPPTPAANPKAPLNPVKSEKKKSRRMTKIQSRIIRMMDKVKAKSHKRLDARMKHFFHQMGLAAHAAYLHGSKANMDASIKADADRLRADVLMSTMDMGRYKSELRGIFGTHYVSVHNETVSELAALGIGVDLPDNAQLEVLYNGGTRAGLVDLTDAAKEKAFEIIKNGREQGMHPDEIAKLLQEAIPAGPFTSTEIRAELIARTETRFAQTDSAWRAYKTIDGVTSVMMIDARLGVTDEDCEEVNGEDVSFEEAQNLLGDEHPNGTRDLVPVFA